MNTILAVALLTGSEAAGDVVFFPTTSPTPPTLNLLAYHYGWDVFGGRRKTRDAFYGLAVAEATALYRRGGTDIPTLRAAWQTFSAWRRRAPITVSVFIAGAAPTNAPRRDAWRGYGRGVPFVG